MAQPPRKRQRQLVVLSSSDAEENSVDYVDKSPEKIHKVLASRPKTNGALKPRQRASQASAHSTPASSPTKSSKPVHTTKARSKEPKSGSLYSFFNAKTESQKVSHPAESSQTKAQVNKAATGLDDIIEDDSTADEKSISSQSRHPSSCTAPLRQPSLRSTQTTSFSKETTVSATIKPISNQSQRFSRPALKSDNAVERTANRHSDKRPWAERYGPLNLEELAVHKKKVADVRGWIQSAFEGRHRHVRSTMLLDSRNIMYTNLFDRDSWF